MWAFVGRRPFVGVDVAERRPLRPQPPSSRARWTRRRPRRDDGPIAHPAAFLVEPCCPTGPDVAAPIPRPRSAVFLAAARRPRSGALTLLIPPRRRRPYPSPGDPPRNPRSASTVVSNRSKSPGDESATSRWTVARGCARRAQRGVPVDPRVGIVGSFRSTFSSGLDCGTPVAVLGLVRSGGSPVASRIEQASNREGDASGSARFTSATGAPERRNPPRSPSVPARLTPSAYSSMRLASERPSPVAWLSARFHAGADRAPRRTPRASRGRSPSASGSPSQRETRVRPSRAARRRKSRRKSRRRSRSPCRSRGCELSRTRASRRRRPWARARTRAAPPAPRRRRPVPRT